MPEKEYAKKMKKTERGKMLGAPRAVLATEGDRWALGPCGQRERMTGGSHGAHMSVAQKMQKGRFNPLRPRGIEPGSPR